MTMILIPYSLIFRKMTDVPEEVSKKVSRPSRTLKRPLKLSDTPQVSRQRKQAQSSGTLYHSSFNVSLWAK